MTAQALLTASGVTKRFGGFVANDHVDLAVQPGERLGLIGPNGSGKSTLVNLLTGVLRPDEGSIVLDGVDITPLPAWRRTRLGVARSFQIPRPFQDMTVRENVAMSFEFCGRFESARDRQEAVESLLVTMQLADLAHRRPRGLNQIALRRLELARAVATGPRLLIADEAMAGLSSSEVDEVIEILLDLNKAGMAIVMIEHVMRAIVRFSERVIVLVAGKKIATGSPDEVLARDDVRRVYLGE